MSARDRSVTPVSEGQVPDSDHNSFSWSQGTYSTSFPPTQAPDVGWRGKCAVCAASNIEAHILDGARLLRPKGVPRCRLLTCPVCCVARAHGLERQLLARLQAGRNAGLDMA